MTRNASDEELRAHYERLNADPEMSNAEERKLIAHWGREDVQAFVALTAEKVAQEQAEIDELENLAALIHAAQRLNGGDPETNMRAAYEMFEDRGYEMLDAAVEVGDARGVEVLERLIAGGFDVEGRGRRFPKPRPAG
jgi:hypothetical protein